MTKANIQVKRIIPYKIVDSSQAIISTKRYMKILLILTTQIQLNHPGCLRRPHCCRTHNNLKTLAQPTRNLSKSINSFSLTILRQSRLTQAVTIIVTIQSKSFRIKFWFSNNSSNFLKKLDRLSGEAEEDR